MTTRWAPLGFALVLAAGAAFGPAPARGEQGPKAAADLSGHWRLNKELSDDEQAKARASVEVQFARDSSGSDSSSDSEREASGRGGRGRRGGTGGAGSRPSLPADDVGDDEDPRGPRQTAGPADALTITQTDPEIVVAELSGPTRRFYPDGRSYKADEGASDVKSRWRDGTLVVEKKSVHGWRLSEIWQLAPDRSRLQLSLRFEGGSRPR
jgi:hypothetical protein